MLDSNVSPEIDLTIADSGHRGRRPDGTGIVIAMSAGALFWAGLLAMIW